MRKFLKLAVIYVLGIPLAGVLTVGMLLGFLFLQKQICHMDEEKWKDYFEKISNKQIIGCIFLMFGISMGLMTLLCESLCKYFGFVRPKLFSMGFFLFGIGNVLFSYYEKRDELHQKLHELRMPL